MKREQEASGLSHTATASPSVTLPGIEGSENRAFAEELQADIQRRWRDYIQRREEDQARIREAQAAGPHEAAWPQPELLQAK